MCWAGEPGPEGRGLTTKEAMSKIIRHGLTGKLQEAKMFQEKFGISMAYYGFSISREELLHQITVPPVVSLYETPMELTQSILLKNIEKID